MIRNRLEGDFALQVCSGGLFRGSQAANEHGHLTGYAF